MKEQPIKIRAPKQRKYTLTVTGYQAAKLLNGRPDDDEFAFFCPGCLRPLSMCSCPMQADTLPMDALPHIEIKKVQS